jgi:DNA-binding IclR family transcriptional regulator
MDIHSEKTDELAHFGTNEGNQLVHDYRSHGSQAVELGSQPGTRDDLMVHLV